MTFLIAAEISAGQAIAEQRGLPEREAEAFSSYRIHSARRVADQNSVASVHATQGSHSGDRAAFTGGVFGLRKTRAKFWKFPEHIFQSQLVAVRDQRYAYFFPGNRRDVNLAATTPVQFREAAPWRDTVVAAESEAPIRSLGCSEL